MHAGLGEIALLSDDGRFATRRPANNVYGLGIGSERDDAQVQWLCAADDVAVVIALRNCGPIGIGGGDGWRWRPVCYASFVIRQRSIRRASRGGRYVHDTAV